MEVTVVTIVSERHFGVILSARVSDVGHPMSGRVIRVRADDKALPARPRPGEAWEIEGDLRETSWGPQLEASRARRRLPAGRLVRDYLASHVPGIGPERAQALWLRFGLELPSVLADDDRIPEIAGVIAPDRPNLAPRLAVACAQAWRRMAGETGLVFWLMERGVEDVRIARRVGRVLGDDAVARLEANPYVLAALLPWGKVDALGLAVLAGSGCAAPREDIRRLVGAVDGIVRSVIADGNTMIGDQGLREAIARQLRVAVRSPLVAEAIAAAERNQGIVGSASGWRAPGCASMEDAVVARLRRMLADDYPANVAVPAAGALLRLLDELADPPHGHLHPEQRAAAADVLQRPLSCLQGGAGVGKTTTTRIICDAWERSGGTVVLCAIAGKAALRLSRSTGRLAMTVARLLHQLRERADTQRELAEGEADDMRCRALRLRLATLASIAPDALVVVDEASMLDLASAHSLLRRMPEGARLLLVGDEAQLPPVGFGLVFHRLVQDGAITARLAVVHRQSEASGIPIVAAAIRNARTPELPAYAGAFDGVSILECDPQSVARAVVRVRQDLCVAGAEPLVVTATNDGEAGIHSLNAKLHELHVGGSEDAPQLKGPLGDWFSPGEPVIFLRNDYRLGLFNGLLGMIVAVDPELGSCSVLFEGCNCPGRAG